MTWTFKKLNYEKKLGLYFSLVTSLIFKYYNIRKRCYFLKGTVTTSVLSACQMFVECVDNP